MCTGAGLQRALDRAIAAENREPKGLPAEDIEALDTPRVRRAFHNAARRTGKTCPVVALPGGCTTCNEETNQ